MLERITQAVRAWDAATRTPRYRAAGVVVGLAMALTVLALPAPAGLSDAAHRTLAVAVLMAVWWVGNVFPMAATALVPLLAFPLLGVSSLKAAAAPFAHPMIFLMLGGFVLGHGMERVRLHSRLTAILLRPDSVRRGPRRVLFALMLATAILSGLVSNTATTLMMLPLATSLAALYCEDPRAQSGFVLGLAYSASIGGVWSLVGTPPNAVFAGLAGESGIDIGFAQWMLIGVPFVVVALPVAWLVVSTLMIPAEPRAPVPRPQPPDWAPGERSVLGVVAAAMGLWLTRSWWSAWIPASGSELDAVVAVAAAITLFLLPAEKGFLLNWKDLEQALPWSVLLLLGGGFSLATAIKTSGLTTWLAGGAAGLGDLPGPLAVGVICITMTFVTELTSNTASTQIALPLLEAAARQVGVNPLIWMVPATISASCAFMMPVATAPNAIAAEAGNVSPGDMALCGVILNLVLAVVVTGMATVAVPLLF